MMDTLDLAFEFRDAPDQRPCGAESFETSEKIGLQPRRADPSVFD
jgi:hypothetical protein